jgi:predicted glycogen debranching enzyme
MTNIVRRVLLSEEYARNPAELLAREWLVTNGLGGYASGTISGINTRRYHGLLISSLPNPLGRMMMLNQLTETVILPDGSRVRLSGEERTSCSLQMYGNCDLKEFRLQNGMPVWHYEINGIVLEKYLFMRYKQNTVQITWKIVSGGTPVTLELHPAVHFRSHQSEVDVPLERAYTITVAPDYYELSNGPELPGLKMLFYGSDVNFTVSPVRIEEFVYRQEESCGYAGIGALWVPGYFKLTIKPQSETTLVVSTHTLETIQALTPEEAFKAENARRELLLGSAHQDAMDGPAAELVLAADQFIITPAGRREDTARIRASGGEVRTLIAGYHWFNDWGRDTMISLEGLTLLTGRYLEARWILLTFAHYIRNGLLPNMFPEGRQQGVYNTADATLWFFHALDRYLEYTHDRTTLRLLLPDLLKIIDFHNRGTDFGIRVDSSDGLLTEGAETFALTWMDAKVGDWVVTPRRGKAVEINALWYNALCLLERWVTEEMGTGEAQFLKNQASLVRESFNRRFWYSEGRYLYDVVDGENGDDRSCRPNQILAISLSFPVLEKTRWQPVIDIVTQKLLTPVGLRSLSPDHPEYKPKYFGDIHSRDSAYHQGTVWAWLIGPYIDAWIKLYPEQKNEARHLLDGLISQLNMACVGSISEIFDAESPYEPRGCVAQAWSVAETLRGWVKTK